MRHVGVLSICSGGRRALFALSLALALAACDSDSPTEPQAAPAPLPLTRQTDHFILRYSDATASLVDAYAAALEASWARVTADLGQGSLPRIEGMLHPTQSSFTAATGYAATGSVEGPNRFHMVAVPLSTQVAVHEFAHNVTLHLAPGAANDPTWLWEAVAVYEAGQLVPPSSLPSLVAGSFPTLAALNDRGSSVSIYAVGFVLTEFVVDGWGLAGVRQLLLARGDTQSALGLSTAEFERRWKEFVVRRYL
jgi:hypothetical protein